VTCEVEISGDIQQKGPAPAKQHLFVYFAVGDCLAKDAEIVSVMPAGHDGHHFSNEVFVKWGSDISICAAAAEAVDKPTTLYGKAEGNFHAEKGGEVIFQNVVVGLKPGPKRVFPPAKKSG
jgi:hypothetical protein